MDADYDPKKAKETLLEELKKNMGKKRRNRKRKSKLAELLSEEKPKFVPDEDKTYSQFMEEYYKMDCEDVIGGDLPTRFKYREVVPNDYGLTIEEILLADDKELTQWVPFKKIVKYRPDNVEKGEVKVYSQKAADKKLKKKILPSLFQDLPEEPEVVVPTEQTKKKKKKKKNKEQSQISVNEQVDNQQEKVNGLETKSTSEQAENDELVENVSKKSKKKKKKNKFVVETTEGIVPSQSNIQVVTEHKNLKDEDDSKQKLKRKSENTQETQVPKKKRKKNKQKTNNAQENGKTEKHNKNKFKQKKNSKEKGTADPMGNLSDERLKAYGLNPKKYRSFLKYKKF